MAVEFRTPSFGESVTEAIVSRWLKKEGDRVEQDEPIVVLETDKVTSEVPALARGVLAKILKNEGETASIGEVLALIEATADAVPGSVAATRVNETAGAAAASVGLAAAADTVPPTREKPGRAASPRPAAGREPRATPGARRVPPEAGPPPETVVSSVTPRQPREEAPRLAARPAALADSPLRVAPPRTLPKPARVSAPPVTPGLRQEELVPMSPLRRTIAERMVQAQNSAALLTTFNEIDMSAVLDLRRQIRPRFEAKYEVKLGIMSFFVKGVVDALKLVPQVNAQVQGDAILYRNYYHVGVAVGGGRGVVAPVVRDADQLSFAEIERAIADFAERAQDSRLTLEELQGGTFTISNGGVYGSMLSTPIVNYPQSGILGLHAIKDRPVARDGHVVIRPMMFVALTYDHRIIDGREAVTFLERVKECIEDPTRMLLEV